MTVDTLTIPIRETLFESLRGLGDPEKVAEAALRRYAVDNCLQHIEQAERRIAVYEQQYGLDYATFNRRICTDQEFLDAVNQEHPLWEADAIEWVHRIEEAQAWRERL
ncbi:MAG: hypothetical protein H8D78_15955 [Chloroflexi bacterium]|nr:hypothetical protein [Chloroflexota bacterium]